MDKITLKNKNCVITYDPVDKHFSGTDLTDQWNIPRMYTRNRRSHKKAWEMLKSIWGDDTTMGDVITVMINCNMDPHEYCAMD